MGDPAFNQVKNQHQPNGKKPNGLNGVGPEGGDAAQAQSAEVRGAGGTAALLGSAGGGTMSTAGAVAGQVAGANAAPATTNITFSANYREVPGKGKDRVAPREANDALWFDPLAVHANVPSTAESMTSKGVVAGTGEQQIDTFAVPVTTGTSPVGTGSVTPALRFASSLNTSFQVFVTLPAGVKGKDKAEAKARAFLEKKMKVFGDADQLETQAAAHLAAEGIPDAQVKIAVNTDKTSDVGMSTFYYRARNNPAIVMEILAQPDGEKTVQYSETKNKENKVEKESERHGEQSVETTDWKYNELMVDMLTDYVKRVDEARSELISKLSDVIIDDATYSKDVREKEREVSKEVGDLSKKVKTHTEKGQKDKKNWAEKLKGPLGWLKKITKIPLIDKIPGIRRVKSWQLDLIDAGLDLFATKGKVDYSDTTEDTTQKDKRDKTRDKTRSEDTDIKSRSKHDQKRELREWVTSQSQSEWQRNRERIVSVQKEFSSKTEKKSEGGSDRVKTNENTSTTVTVSGGTNWKFSKPVVKATVVSGDGEVGNEPFKVSPDEVG